jgi:hypothetical protein
LPGFDLEKVKLSSYERILLTRGKESLIKRLKEIKGTSNSFFAILENFGDNHLQV